MDDQTPDAIPSSQPETQAPSNLNRRRFLQTAALSVASGGAALAAGCKYQTQLFLLKEAPTETK